MRVRRERTDDAVEAAAVRAIHAAAFGGGAPDTLEARLLDALRADDGWLPALSLVAEIEGRIVGHNVCTRGTVDGAPCLGLGPVGVVPDVQRGGIGSALMWAMIGAADALGEPAIALLGDPQLYSRFGFVESTTLGIAPPDEAWGPFFQALPLSAYDPGLCGTFRYATPFVTVT